METIDDETVSAAMDFIKRQQKAGKPWFVWWNGTRMHFRTHVRKEHRGLSAVPAATNTTTAWSSTT
jgi:arylsulfatase